MKDKDPTEKPTPLEGTLPLKVGQFIRKGDFKWDPAAKKWQEIVDAINITVLPKWDGLYCRRY